MKLTKCKNCGNLIIYSNSNIKLKGFYNTKYLLCLYCNKVIAPSIFDNLKYNIYKLFN